MTAFSPDDHRKLVGILGRLGSDAEGERAAAGLLATQLLDRHGVGWADLFAPLPNGKTPEFAHNPRATSRANPHRGSYPEPVRLLREHQRTAWLLLASPYPWNDWQAGFLSDLRRLDAPLSARQESKLRECRRLASEWRVAA